MQAVVVITCQSLTKDRSHEADWDGGRGFVLFFVNCRRLNDGTVFVVLRCEGYFLSDDNRRGFWLDLLKWHVTMSKRHPIRLRFSTTVACILSVPGDK